MKPPVVASKAFSPLANDDFISAQNQRDERIRAGFDQIEIGMTHQQVTGIMGSAREGESWIYRISPLSNTSTERDIAYRIYFKDALVSSKDVGYTCLYAVPRD